MVNISIPNGFVPRPYQLPSWSKWYHDDVLRQLLVWHRRSGKDEIELHKACVAAHRRTASYWHMLPEYSQARKAVWTAVDPHTGQRRIDVAFPKELRTSTNEQEMFIRFKCGSTWQLVGSDNFDSLVGTPPAGIVFSEWALSNPSSWAYLAPILAENGGWADFITTPRGRNHVKSMWDARKNDPLWFCQLLTVEDTGFSLSLVEQQRSEYIDIFGEDQADQLIRQEYYCSFDAPIPGSYWGRELIDAEMEGRLRTSLEPIPGIPVDTVMDIGVSDSTAMWFFQVAGNTIRVLDYLEEHGKSVEYYKEQKDLRADRFDYHNGFDYVPHDAKQRSWTSTVHKGTVVDFKTGERFDSDGDARQRIEDMRELGMNPRLIPGHSIADGINAARKTLKRCIFDMSRCEDGIECLRAYCREWDSKNLAFHHHPKRNWATHGADAFRYLSMAWSMVKRPEKIDPKPKEPSSLTIVASPIGHVRTNMTFNQLRDRNAKRNRR